MTIITSRERVDRLLSALSEHLAAAGESYELVVIGGSALLALGTVARATTDIDVLALRDDATLIKASPLPAALVAARDRVGRDYGLPVRWLNPGPADLIDLGLPAGFASRLQARAYGGALTVQFAARLDQIHFKLYAFADQGPGKHESDLQALAPTRDELLQAARWARTHDPSEGFEQVLRQALSHMGVDDVDLGA
jgi:hypothetical protein